MIISGQSALGQKIIIVDGNVNTPPTDNSAFKKLKKESEYTLVNLLDSTDHAIFFKDILTLTNYIFSVKGGNVDLSQCM